MILRPITGNTPEELKNHIKILHGIYVREVDGLAELIECHDQAHADESAGHPTGHPIPHEHVPESLMFDDGAEFEW